MQQNLTDKINGSFKPELAVIVYKWNSEYYLESHEIKEGVMGAGLPMKEECIQDMVEFFKGKERKEALISGPVPETLLFCKWGLETKTIVWFNPPRIRKMSFTKELSIQNGNAWQPSLVYVLEDGELTVYAMTCKGRPSDKEQLFRAPYHNVSDDGSVCLGSAKTTKPKEITYTNLIDYYEKLFWQSEFSHLAGNDTPVKGNVNTYWKAAIKSGAKFDNKILLSGKNQSLNAILKNLSK